MTEPLLRKLRHPELGLGLNLSLSQGGSFNPQILFANAEPGLFYIPSPATCFTDTAGTTNAAVGDPVARINDLSGRGNNATQGTLANRPILRSGTGGYYLEFDGSNDRLTTGSIDFSASDELSAITAIRKLSDAATGAFLAFTSNPDTQAGAFFLGASYDATNEYGWQSRGSATAIALLNNASYAAPVSNVLTGKADISTDTCTLRANGTQVATSATNQGTGNYANAVLTIGTYSSGTSPFSGHCYGLLIRGGAMTTEQTVAVEKYMAAKISLSW